MRIALTGASGFIGSSIARHLHQRGHAVTALVRETSTTDHLRDHVDTFVTGDQTDEHAWRDLLDGADGLIHNSVDWRALRDNDIPAHLESNLLGSLKLLDAASPKRCVFISTIAVHHDMRPRWNGVIDEDHPLRPSSLYGAYKAAVEAHLWSAHYHYNRHTAAIRPCAVYGPDPTGKHGHTRPVLEAVRSGERFTRAGGGKFVHVDDVAAATVAAIERDDASARPFNLVDCYARYADLARYAAEALGIEIDIDFSSPEKPKNTFDCSAAKQLVGEDEVFLNRGHEGLRTHFRELAAQTK